MYFLLYDNVSAKVYIWLLILNLGGVTEMCLIEHHLRWKLTWIDGRAISNGVNEQYEKYYSYNKNSILSS